MEKFIDIFLKATKPLQRLGIVGVFILVIIGIDYFTSWPSIFFIKEKYEAIGAINTIYKDSTVDLQIRKRAYNELIDLSSRNSVRDHIRGICIKVNQVANSTPEIRIPIVINENRAVKDYLIYTIKMLWYLYCSIGLFIGLVFMFPSHGRRCLVGVHNTLFFSITCIYFSLNCKF